MDHIFYQNSQGSAVLEVYCGPMKSGKTREIVNRVDQLNYVENFKFTFVKPTTDTRNKAIESRFGSLSHKCHFVDDQEPSEILHIVDDSYDLVVIDEAQFFSEEIVRVIRRLLQRGTNVIVAGLDLDFRGVPFGPMPQILALADKVHKLKGVCDYPGCNLPAQRTQRLINGEPASYDSPIILVGDAKEGYECRCLKHHVIKK